MRLKVSSAKRRPFCLGLNVLKFKSYYAQLFKFYWKHRDRIAFCGVRHNDRTLKSINMRPHTYLLPRLCLIACRKLNSLKPNDAKWQHGHGPGAWSRLPKETTPGYVLLRNQ